jgi:hypothetical protein
MPEQQIVYLSRTDVEAVNLPVATTIALPEEAFTEKGHGRVEMPPKPGIHTMPDAFMHAVPAPAVPQRTRALNSSLNVPWVWARCCVRKPMRITFPSPNCAEIIPALPASFFSPMSQPLRRMFRSA